MFDLGAYRERIGVGAEDSLVGVGAEGSLAEIHRAHVSTIPFENLDPRRGLPVSLELGALQRKLVADRRGGYCFEHNLLLKGALEALGATVEPMLARVRYRRPADAQLPLTHLLLRVTLGGELWHADVGFGNGTLLEPIPFGAGGPYEQAGWRFRVVEEGDELVLQTESGEGWGDVYAFLPRPVQPIDIELSNWFTSTHPESPFVTRLLVATTALDGTRTVISDFAGELTLTVRTPSGETVEPVGWEQLAIVLRERFGIDGALVDGRLDAQH